MFVPGKPFQPNLMFVGKTGAYPSEAPCFQMLHSFLYHEKEKCLRSTNLVTVLQHFMVLCYVVVGFKSHATTIKGKELYNVTH